MVVRRSVSVLVFVLLTIAITSRLDFVFALNQAPLSQVTSVCHDDIWDDGEFCGRDAYVTTGFPDMNHDCLIDGLDVALFLVQHNAVGPNLSADIDGDGEVHAFDLWPFFTTMGSRVFPCNSTSVPGLCEGTIALSFSPDSTTIINNVSQAPGIYTAYVVMDNFTDARVVEYGIQTSYNVNILDHRPTSGEWLHGCSIGLDNKSIVIALAAPVASGPANVAMIKYQLTDASPATLTIGAGECSYRRVRWSTSDVSVSHDFAVVHNLGINGPAQSATACTGMLGTIAGKVYQDVGNDCVFVSGTDAPISSRVVEVNPGGYLAYTNAAGDYALTVPFGQYTVSFPAVVDDPWKFMSDCQAPTYDVDVAAQTAMTGNDFALAPIGVVTGTVYRDVGNDCVFNAGIDFPIANRLIEINPGGYIGFTGATGNYAIAVQVGQYTVSQALVSGDPWEVQACQSSSSYVVDVLVDATVSGNDFALQLAGPAQCHASVSIVSNSLVHGPPCPNSHPYMLAPCPGVEHEYVFVVNVDASSTIPIAAGSFLDITLDPSFAIATVTSDCVISTASSSGSNQRTVQFDDTLYPGHVCAVTVRATPTSDGPYETSVILDDAGLCTGAKMASLTETDQCSCDPNDMAVAPAGCGPDGEIVGETPLTYTVRFENVGSGRAHNIFIRGELDDDLDLGSLHVVAASHAVTGMQVNPGNILLIRFDGIELPGTYNPQDNNKGYVIFMIDPKPGLVNGTTIENTAAITFDFNEPVITNTVVNTIQSNPCPATGIGPGVGVPTANLLGQNHPNPFNPSTTIEYGLVAPERVTISVYNVRGELVQNLVEGRLPAGWHTVDWNGRDQNGNSVASGVYLYRMRAGSFVDTKKLVLLK